MSPVEVLFHMERTARVRCVDPTKCVFKMHPRTLYDVRMEDGKTSWSMSFEWLYATNGFQKLILGVPVETDEQVPMKVIRLEWNGVNIVSGRYS